MECSFNKTSLSCDLFVGQKMESTSVALCAQAVICACFLLMLTMRGSAKQPEASYRSRLTKREGSFESSRGQSTDLSLICRFWICY